MSILGQFGLLAARADDWRHVDGGPDVSPGQAVGMVGVCRVRYDGAWRRRCPRDGAHGAVGLVSLSVLAARKRSNRVLGRQLNHRKDSE